MVFWMNEQTTNKDDMKIENVNYQKIGGILCIVVAGVIAATGHEGWGWFLFGGVYLVM